MTILCMFAVFFTQLATAANVDPTQFMKDSSGAALQTKYDEAVKVCRQLGQRLPTANEFALFAARRGALRPVASAYSNISVFDRTSEFSALLNEQKSFESKGFKPVFRVDEARQEYIDFYYKTGAYHFDGPAKRFWFWSSRQMSPYAYTFAAYSGELVLADTTSFGNSAFVVCVP